MLKYTNPLKINSNYRVAACPEEAPKIDWAYYKANAANKAIVEQLEKQYNSIKFPYPDDQGAYSKLDSEREVYVSTVKIISLSKFACWITTDYSAHTLF